MPETPRTQDEFADALTALLPEGPFWQGFRDRDGRGRTLLLAKARLPADVDQRAADLVREANPLGAAEMLAAREREAGLPDECSALYATTLQERRAALAARWRARGGQSKPFYVALAASLGYPITITEFRPFRVGQNACGDPLCDEEWTFVWRVNAPETTIRYFRTGASTTGEPLRKWGNELLECAIGRVKPAHTLVQFGYGGT